MKEKTIKNVLSNKFNHLLKSIEDEDVKKIMRNGTIITGGCITSMLLNEEINDFDCYFKDHYTATSIAEYFVNKFNNETNETKSKVAPVKMYVKSENNMVRIFIKSAGIVGTDNDAEYDYFEQDPQGDISGQNFIDSAVYFEKNEAETKRGEYKPVVLTANSISLSGAIQLIIRFFGDPDEIHKNYDFVHCTNYWTSWDEKLTLRKEALVTILAKELRYTGSLYPICSMFRVRKFIERGWTINAGQILKMAFQISKLDLEDPLILEDQLTGVDIAYFHQLLQALRNDIKDGKTIDQTYVAQLIDEIF